MSSVINILAGIVSRISIEVSDAGRRFVMSIMIPPTPNDQTTRYEYFSTPLSSPDSVRINTQQLRNAFPQLMGITEPEKVFLHLMTHRKDFIGQPVHITVTPQIDRETKQPKMNATTGRPYTNVRLEASSENLSEQDALALLGSTLTTGALANAATPAEVEDVPM